MILLDTMDCPSNDQWEEHVRRPHVWDDFLGNTTNHIRKRQKLREVEVDTKV